MLVHPDKNRENENAAEAFKKLQNAYEVMFFFSLSFPFHQFVITASRTPVSDLPSCPLGIA